MTKTKQKKHFLFILLIILSSFLVVCAKSEGQYEYDWDKVDAIAGTKMLIVTTSKYKRTLKEYINWKKQRGFDV